MRGRGVAVLGRAAGQLLPSQGPCRKVKVSISQLAFSTPPPSLDPSFLCPLPCPLNSPHPFLPQVFAHAVPPQLSCSLPHLIQLLPSHFSAPGFPSLSSS